MQPWRGPWRGGSRLAGALKVDEELRGGVGAQEQQLRRRALICGRRRRRRARWRREGGRLRNTSRRVRRRRALERAQQVAVERVEQRLNLVDPDVALERVMQPLKAQGECHVSPVGCAAQRKKNFRAGFFFSCRRQFFFSVQILLLERKRCISGAIQFFV